MSQKKTFTLRIGIVAFAALSALICLLIVVFSKTTEETGKEIQKSFLTLEEQASLEAQNLIELKTPKYSQKDPKIYLHLYENDSLTFWNTNKMPVPRLASLVFPSAGLIHLKNGWYYSVKKTKGNKTAIASFLIKHSYAYENEYLSNNVNPNLSERNFSLSLDEQEGKSVKNKSKKYCFSYTLKRDKKKETNAYVLFFGAVFCLLVLAYFLTLKQRLNMVLTVSVWHLLMYLLSLSGIITSDLLSPKLFGYNQLLPNLFSICIVIMALAFLILAGSKSKILQSQKGRFWKPLLLLSVWWIVEGVIPFVLNNSNVPIGLHNLFELKPYSYFLIALFVLLFLSYNVLLRNTLRGLLSKTKRTTVNLLFLLCVSFFVLELFVLEGTFFSIALPVSLTITNLVFLKKEAFNQRLIRSVLSTILLTTSLVSLLTSFNVKKDLQSRKVLAKKVVSERDVELELKYEKLSKKLEESNYLRKIISGKQENLSASMFSNVLENKYFNGFWEGYELSFNLFDSVKNAVVINEITSYENWENSIKKKGASMGINSNVYFLPDAPSSLNYIIQQQIKSENKVDTLGTLIVSLRSRLVPEEIGFPRLLISNKANTLQYLKKYSIAKYKNGQLKRTYGTYSYPNELKKYTDTSTTMQIYDGHSHYVFRGPYGSTVVLSKKTPEGLELFTPYAYVFCLMGLLRLVFLLFSGGGGAGLSKTISLAFKIQVILVSMVVLSLFLFGAGSGLFVKNQYANYNKRTINEKLQSVSEELKNKAAKKEKIDIIVDGGFLEKTLSKLSRVFLTDINIYDENGFMISSSRPRVFNTGLLSEQINPTAFESLKKREKNSFVHEESIGKMVYTSSYKPIHNKQGKTIGFINLEHFGQQEDYENQIQAFLVAIINVFMFLLALSIILSLVISNWLTRPLQILQESLSGLKLGSKNEKIQYTAQDEIGMIVNAYNEKIEELEAAAERLTKTERETAWREMAKQIAHEIKNPLTPMKLSVQHLLRVYDPKKPEESSGRIKKVVDSIIEQIDGLTKIANEFSNFARIPLPLKEKQDLILIIKNTIVVYEERESYKIRKVSSDEKLNIFLDKAQIIQVLNNLIKNSIQSLQNNERGEIIITCEEREGEAFVSVSDNGSGIKKEDQERLFTPYFTTKTKGSGIGLSVVKQIIENHGGKVSFEPGEIKGSVFSFTIPME